MKRIVIFLAVLITVSAVPCLAADAPTVSAKSAVLMTFDGDILFEKNADCRLPMASTTKIMTCLIAAERCTLSDVVTITPASAEIEGSSLYMKSGDRVTAEDLLYAAMLRSANDAASALAIHVSGDEEAFAELMNERASELGMNGTHFTNPHGLPDDEHYTTARDFAHLAAAAMKNDTFAKIAGTKEYVVTLNGSEKRPVKNHNRLLFSYDGALGVKTGFTKASGRCLVSAAERDGVSLIAVTLCAPDDWNDHRKMLDYGFEITEHVTTLEKGQISRKFHVFGEGTVTALNTESLEATLVRGADISYTVEGDRFPALPISKGDTLAIVTVSSGGRVIGSVPLAAAEDVPMPPKEGFFRRIKNLFG